MKLRRMIQTTGLLLLGSTVTAAYGQVTPPDTEWFTRFSQCDAEFFKTLQQQAPLFRQVAPLEKQGEYTRFKMPGPNSPKKEQLMFTQPLKLGDIELIGYRNEIDDLERLGIYYFWGFITRGTVKEVAEKIHPFVYENQRFRQDGESFVRSEIRIGSRWTPSKSTSNTPPGLSRVERVFLVEPSHEDPNAVFISCSIQGGIEKSLLEETRPDLGPSEYVVKPPLPPFTELPVPAKVLSTINAATHNLHSDWWKPKFKQLRYVVINQLEDGTGSVTIDQKITVTDDKMLVERYDPPSGTKVLARSLDMIGSLLNLKQESFFANHTQYVTTDVTLNLPHDIKIPGAKTEIKYRQEHFPDATPAYSVPITCQTIKTFPAQELNLSLTGNAVELTCTQGEHKFPFLFLDDLGIGMYFDLKDKKSKLVKIEIKK